MLISNAIHSEFGTHSIKPVTMCKYSGLLITAFSGSQFAWLSSLVTLNRYTALTSKSTKSPLSGLDGVIFNVPQETIDDMIVIALGETV